MSVRDQDLSNIDKCYLIKVILFVLAVLLTSVVSIGAKIIMSLSSSSSSSSSSGAVGTEQHSLLLTFGQFVSMSFALVMHAFVMYFRIPFPGYNHLIATTTLNNNSAAEQENVVPEDSSVGDDSFVVSNGIRKMINHTESDDTIGMTHYTDSDADDTVGITQYTLIDESDNVSTDTASLPLFPIGYIVANKESKIMGQPPLSMYFIIAIPTLLDISATALSVAGLYYLDVTFYQMISNSNIVFVALMKHHILKNYLHKFQWIGMFWIVVSVFIGGSSALLVDQMSKSSDVTADDDGVSVTDTLIGVLLVIAGTILKAVCALVEEKLMKLDAPVPPLLLIGIEGLWGVVLSIFVMFPVGYALPGNDQGSYENPFNTWSLLMSSRNIQLAFSIYIVGILFWDICVTLVILQLSSIWYSISINFSIAVSWAADLFIFYYVSPKFGEEWTQYDYIQIAGIAVLVYGTAVYNAPNKGGLRLRGQVWAFGFDCSEEYSKIKEGEGIPIAHDENVVV